VFYPKLPCKTCAITASEHHGQIAPNKLPIDGSAFFPVGSTANIFREQEKGHRDIDADYEPGYGHFPLAISKLAHRVCWDFSNVVK